MGSTSSSQKTDMASKQSLVHQKQNLFTNEQIQFDDLERYNPLKKFISKSTKLNPIVASKNIYKKDRINQSNHLQNIILSPTKRFSTPFSSIQPAQVKSQFKSQLKPLSKSKHLSKSKPALANSLNKYFRIWNEQLKMLMNITQQKKYIKIQINHQHFIKFKKEENIRIHYEFHQIIGEGTFGWVYRATCRNTKELRAVKVLKASALNDKLKKHIFSEIQILKKMDHPNIIKLYEAFENQQGIFLVTEYCGGGSIANFINEGFYFQEDVIKNIMEQILSSLNYLHQSGITHRDIKLENIVFSRKVERSDQKQILIKLIDFGTAYQMNIPVVRCLTPVGTNSYMAPEMILGSFSTKCDLWSCGIVLYILLTSKTPFRCATKDATIHKTLNYQIDYKNHFDLEKDKKAIDLLKKLLQKKFDKRISAEQALKHCWLQRKKSVKTKPNPEFLKDLANYYRQNNFISILESYLAFRQISQDLKEKITSNFQFLDKNSDGFVDFQELREAYQHDSKEIKSEQIEHLMQKLNKDMSGRISLSQFMVALMNKKQMFIKKYLLEAFDFIDEDQNGFIEKKELQSLMKGSQNEEIQSYFKQIDSDQDQKISKAQFLEYLMRKADNKLAE